VGALDNGVIYFFASDNYRIIEDLQRFAYERKSLEENGAAASHPKLLLNGRAHRHNPSVHLAVATSAHGAFAVLTSTNPSTVRALREEASFAVRNNSLIRF